MYNDHFQIKVTGKTKPQLIAAIESGLEKKVTQEIRDAHTALITVNGKMPKETAKTNSKKKNLLNQLKKKVVRKIKVEEPNKKVASKKKVAKTYNKPDTRPVQTSKPILDLSSVKKSERGRATTRRRAFLTQSMPRPKL